MDAASNRLARLLIAEGAGPERIIALALPRLHRAGRGRTRRPQNRRRLLPIDPAYPAERVEFMLQDATPALAVTTTALRPVFHDQPLTTVEYDAPGTTRRLAEQSPCRPHRRRPDTSPDPAQPGVRHPRPGWRGTRKGITTVPRIAVLRRGQHLSRRRAHSLTLSIRDELAAPGGWPGAARPGEVPRRSTRGAWNASNWL
ncbi:hypothetical protein [Streptomyces hygroscopicus]|uniref:hypothetical protein n=1 Tax=Streptomyces hygroscopicus TaxID=1912 RepID=UPI003F1A54DA